MIVIYNGLSVCSMQLAIFDNPKPTSVGVACHPLPIYYPAGLQRNSLGLCSSLGRCHGNTEDCVGAELALVWGAIQPYSCLA